MKTQPFGIVFGAGLTVENILRMELEKLVTARRGEITLCEDSTCVNVSLPTGSFICTSCEYTREENLRECIDFVKHCRIGSVGPAKRPRIQNFGQIVSKVVAMQRAYEIGQEMSDLIDGGEFGNVWQHYEEEVEEMLAHHDLSIAKYREELHERIRMSYHLQYLYP